jgi:hypothetical protein
MKPLRNGSTNGPEDRESDIRSTRLNFITYRDGQGWARFVESLLVARLGGWRGCQAASRVLHPIEHRRHANLPSFVQISDRTWID